MVIYVFINMIFVYKHVRRTYIFVSIVFVTTRNICFPSGFNELSWASSRDEEPKFEARARPGKMILAFLRAPIESRNLSPIQRFGSSLTMSSQTSSILFIS